MGPQTKIRLLDSRAVRKLLTMDSCIALMRTAMTRVSEGRAIQPIRNLVRTPGGEGMLGWMPGWVDGPAALGIKVVAIFPGAVTQGLKSHQGVVMLFDPANGQPLAMMDAGEITGIRTAAATAVATDLLARPEADTLAIFGAGEQAMTHLEALTRVRRFASAVVWARDPAKAEAFAAEQGKLYPFPIQVAATAEAAAAQAEVLCLVTGAPEPFFHGAWLRPGQHLNVVGSSIPTTAEVDEETVVRSRIFVDYRDSALALAGELKRARESGAVGEDHILGEVGDLLLDRVEGRRSDDDITLFKSLGMVSEDLVSAQWLLEEAARTDAGLVIDW